MSIRQFSLTIAAATIQNLRTTNVTQTTIALAWDAYPGATAYEVRRNGTLVLTTASTTWTNSGHTAGTTYTLAVRPVVGGTGVASAQASIVVTTEGASSYTPLRTLYVNNVSGDDSRTITQAQSSSTPWRTIHRAMKGSATAGQTNAAQAATAGDLVLVAATGTPYWETGVSGGRHDVALNPVNNGTASNPLIIKGSGGRPEIRLVNGIRGGTIGANARTYIIWDSVKIDDTFCGSTSDTGPVVFANGSSYCQLVNSEIQGHNGSYHWGYPIFFGNYRLVSLEPASFCTIRNNRISRTFYSGQNEAGVMSYDSGYNIIEQNTFFDCGAAVFIKGQHGSADCSGNVIRRNLIYNCPNTGIRALDTDPNGDTRVYQNILLNSGGGQGCLYPGFTASRFSKYYNNVVMGSARARVAHGTELVGVEFRNNILIANTAASYDFSVSTPASQDVTYDRNLYWNNTRIWQSEGGVQATTLAQWQALSPSRCDPNGASADPLFVNASTNPALANFRLQSGSPALTLGRDTYGTFGTPGAVIPVGAYITGNEQIGADW